MTSRESSRGQHKRFRQIRMDLESTFGKPPDLKEERFKDNIITLFDDDFSPSIKAIKDWLLESEESLESYFKRPSKGEEILRQKLGFLDGMRYWRDILLSELLVDQGKNLEECIMEDLAPLVSNNTEDE